MKIAFNIAAALTGIFVLFMTVGIFLADWERPPMEASQIGYRGTGMEQITNPRLADAALAEVVLPVASEQAPPGARPAREAYENVQVLGDLTEDQFNRIMLSITEWVSPEQGCGYCHNVENLAEDVPNKVVARRMFQMNRHINENWTQHVGQTGVTCYTCHRGQPVPSEIWYRQSTGRATGMLGYDAGQNHPARSVNLSSLPGDPFSEQLDSPDEVRVVGDTALPTGPGPSIKKTEHTYALMIHMSEALGVNCTFCHNSRAFLSWDQSVPAREPAWHAIRMVRELNQSYLVPLQSVFLPERLGPLGDAPKLNCATCHVGQPKPLGGAQMIRDYPELNAATLEPTPGSGPATAPAEEEAEPPVEAPPGQPQRGGPSPDAPAQPAPEVPAQPPQQAPAQEAPAQPAPEAPAPAAPAQPAPAAPPAQPAPAAPAQPAPEPPAQPAPAAPAQPAPEPPAQPAPAAPAQPAPEPPAQPAPQPPAQPAPEAPAPAQPPAQQ